MAGTVVIPLLADPVTRRAVDAYLDALDRELTGPAGPRRAILAEIRDGLLDTVDAHRARGLAPAEAAEHAIGEFGAPAVVARAFTPELAAVQARGFAVRLIRTGPLVGGLWLLALLTSPVGRHLSIPPWQHGWHGWHGLWLAVPPLALVLAVGVVGSLLAIASTGRLTHRIPGDARLAPTAATAAGAASVVCDITLLCLAASQAGVAPDSLAWAPLSLAGLASLGRLLLAGRTLRCCLAARARLG